ncbi:hypothetical protein GOP47_0004620 [Adiantum capillus-veneris]|uniref:Protein TIC 21, chloroplastic n=1 Tax=Adiantum capillus-veneris TaxID=13818 RepID=A0A9D4V8E5_ADICA|nr:hypothetical protein GOP47_0004620 [Adiantum capillus-veneris]
MQMHLSRPTTQLCLASPWPGSLRRREVTVSTYSPSLTSLHAFSPHLSLFTLKFQSGHHTSRRLPNIFSASYSGSETSAREQVSKRLANFAKNLRRCGTLGFWGQLVCAVVSAVILAFSVAISGNPTSQATFYATAGGIVAAFLSVFWSFGYVRLSDRLRSTINDLSKAPPRADVVRNLQQGILLNLLGMGLTLLGMQATVGTLVAKSLTSTAVPYFQGTRANYSPVLALDVFLVQASVNTVLSHFLGLIFSIELLRSVTLSQPPPESVIPKVPS